MFFIRDEAIDDLVGMYERSLKDSGKGMVFIRDLAIDGL